MAQPVSPVAFREDVFCTTVVSNQESLEHDADVGRHGAEAVEPVGGGELKSHAEKPLTTTGSTTPYPSQNVGIAVTEREITPSPSGRGVRFATPTSSMTETTAKESKKTFKTILTKKVHWVSKRVMLGCFVLALAGVLGHHGFFGSLVGRPIGDQMDQQRTRLLGNGFAYIIQAFLVISIDIALTQWLFLCLANRPVTVKCLDAAYSATSSLLFLFSREMYKVLPDVVVLALTIAILTVPTSMVTPGTLYVHQSQRTDVIVTPVTRLAISAPDLEQSTYFHYSRPKTGPNGQHNTSIIFNSPRTILWRLLTAAAGTGEILPIAAPAVNSSYEVQFWAPYVQCEEANTTVMGLIDQALPQTAVSEFGASLVYSGYFAYVPDGSPGRFGQPSQRDSNASRSSNELWLSYKRNGTGWDTSVFPRCPNTEYLVCRLYNTSYHLHVSFLNGRMRIVYDNITDLTPVTYPAPVVDSTAPGELPRLSYTAWFWAFSDLLTGTMAMYAEDVTDKSKHWFNMINSNIQNTALLGSSDLNCFFASGWMYYNQTFRTPTGQRLKDIDFARGGMRLEQLIPELSANLTISLMTDELLAPTVPADVAISTPVDVYAYHTQTLLVSYGMALLAAAAANIMGLVAFTRNEVRMDKTFSSTASATQHTHLLDEVHYGRRGSLPVPGRVREKRVKFRRLRQPGGGWGFEVIVEEEADAEKQDAEVRKKRESRARRALRGVRLRGRLGKKRG